MSRSSISRRQFNKWLLASSLFAGTNISQAFASMSDKNSPKYLRVAAIQMEPVLANAEANLLQAEMLIKEAQKKGVDWIVLPEMFTTAAGFHPDMHDSIYPLDGKPLQMLKQLSKAGNSVIGGSFLASRHQQVFNTFVLVFPDGKVVTHDKDQPTYWENCYYKGGSDDGVLETPNGNVGSVLCWEFIRSKTAKRLLGKVNFVVGGSCWWTVPNDVEKDNPNRIANLKMLKEAAPNMAKMLGVPIIHGSHAGSFEGYFSPDLPDVPYNSVYLGETMIVDAKGKVLVNRPFSEGAGIVTTTIEIPQIPTPTKLIPNRFWIPEEMPNEWKSSWERWLDSGSDYYEIVTSNFLDTGEIVEYEPPYMR